MFGVETEPQVVYRSCQGEQQADIGQKDAPRDLFLSHSNC